MTRTSQLAAHYAVIQVDAVLDHVMRSYIPTLELLVDEFHEQSEARQCDPFYSVEGHRSRRLALFTRYRAAVVALGEALGDIRRDVGVDRADLPAGDADTRRKLDRLRQSAERHRTSTDPGVAL